MSLSLIAAFAYALPRAVFNAVRGFAGWSVSRFYLRGALAYGGILVVVVLIAYRFADLEGFLVGILLLIAPMLANVKRLRADVNERLGKAPVHPKSKQAVP